MCLSDLIISPDTVATYSPAAHAGTVNRRLVGRDTVKADNMEIILGHLAPGGRAEAHFHSEAEQAVYVLSGRATVTVGEETAPLVEGQIVFFPRGVMHQINVEGDASMRCLVVYSPPLPDATSAFERR